MIIAKTLVSIGEQAELATMKRSRSEAGSKQPEERRRGFVSSRRGRMKRKLRADEAGLTGLPQRVNRLSSMVAKQVNVLTATLI